MTFVARCSNCNKLLFPTQKYHLRGLMLCRECGSAIAMGEPLPQRPHKHRWEESDEPAQHKVVETTTAGYYYNLFYDDVCADCGKHRLRLWGGGGPFFVAGPLPSPRPGMVGLAEALENVDKLDLTPEQRAAAKQRIEEVWNL